MAEAGVVCYSYRDQGQANDTHAFGEYNKCFWRVTRFVFTLILLVLVIGASIGGSLLTHFAFAWLPSTLNLGEWQSETIQKSVVAIPLGMVIGMISFNLRAGVALCILTICSLYVPWAPYTCGSNLNGTAVFDFFLGKMPNSGYYPAEFREIAGISLWGMVLTFPSGYILYALGFGSTYSLSGGVIGLIYFFAKHFQISLDTDKPGYHLWGFLVWFVLLIISVNRLCTTIRFVVNKTKQPLVLRCYQFVCYSKLYICLFEILAFLFTILLLSCLFFLALADVSREEKGPVLFGLVVNTLALATTQSYRTGKCVNGWQRKRRERRDGTVRINQQVAPQTIRPEARPARNNTSTGPPTYNQVLGAEPHLYPEILPENDRPNPAQVSNRIQEDENNVEGFQNERTTLLRGQEAPRRKSKLHDCFMCIFFFQKFFYTDILRMIQLLLDLMGSVALASTFALTIVASVHSWDSPRF